MNTYKQCTRYSVGLLLILLLLFASISSCKKLVGVQPPVTSLSSQNVYSTDATAIAAVTSIYSAISYNGPFTAYPEAMSGVAGLSADDFTLYPGFSGSALNLYYQNALTNSNGLDFWVSIYPIIHTANDAIEAINKSSTLTVLVKQRILGEAKFSRALCYFYLVNLYGDVPLVLSPNFSINAALPRTPRSQVWQQIIQDLREAASLLSTNYLDATLLNNTNERVRPTHWAATALLARTYLYMANWVGADSAASAVIENSSSYRLNGLDSVFLKNSDEAIWQLPPVANNGFNTQDAMTFILPSTGPDSYQHYVYLSNSLYNSFDSSDNRRSHWINEVIVNGVSYYYPFKYKSATLNDAVTEYTMVLRLGEQYLIRAEAKAQENKFQSAQDDLNSIRARAGLGPTSASDQVSLLNAIAQERRLELFSEWGHRWLDLKRTGKVDAVMGTGGGCAVKGGIWNTNWQWYPIPLSELQADPKLVQNPGY